MSNKDRNRFEGLFSTARVTQPVEQISAGKDKKEAERTTKSTDPTYQRTTLYIPKALHRQFKSATIDEGQEMSEVMEKLIQQWLDSRRNA
jgi:hypothetical protein